MPRTRMFIAAGKVRMANGHAVTVNVPEEPIRCELESSSITVWLVAASAEYEDADVRAVRIPGGFLIIDDGSGFTGDIAYEVFCWRSNTPNGCALNGRT